MSAAGDDEDYFDTLYKYFGKPGWYIGIISTGLLTLGAACVIFVIMTTLLYPMLLCIASWISGREFEMQT